MKNYDNYNRYIDDLESLPQPMDLPKVPDRNNYTYDLSRRNDMNYNVDDDAANILLFSS